jgi:putative transposase
MEDLLKNHVSDPVSFDFFTVPTTIHKALLVLLILAHDRRRVVHCRVTEHPTAEWTARELVEAFPCDEATPYLRRDRNNIYGTHFRQRVRIMGIEEVLIAPRSPWQSP